MASSDGPVDQPAVDHRAAPPDISPIDENPIDLPYDQAVAILEQMAHVELPRNARVPRQAEGGLSAAQMRYRALVEQIPAVTFMAALDETIHELYISPQIEALLGFSQEEWLKDPFLWYRRLHPDDSAQWGLDFARTCATGVNFKSEYRLIARDGRVVWIHGECQLITDENGRPLFLMGIAFDITDRKVAEQRLQETNQQLEQARAALTEMNVTLERRVEARTAELEEAHTRMVQIARQAGMAEVASEVLHNVGNVFNSVNIRATFVREKVTQSRVVEFKEICDAFEKYATGLGSFLSAEGEGRFLPEYVVKLARHLMTERESLVEEMEVLNRHLQHIRQLVSSQQSYAKGAVMYEMANVENLVTDAMNITYATVARHNVTVEREIPSLPRLMLDRHKILQILVNLLSNAAQACAASGKADRRIQISVYQPQVELIVFQVADNGIGIPAENRVRIFSHGFTTRSDGHGFGLHSCANAAGEMGGSLNVLSDGVGMGATFVLSLPISSKKPGG